MSTVFILSRNGPSVEAYELKKRGKSSVTVFKRSGEQTIRQNYAIEFIFDRVALDKRIKGILEARKLNTERQLVHIEEMLRDGVEIKSIPAY